MTTTVGLVHRRNFLNGMFVSLPPFYNLDEVQHGKRTWSSLFCSCMTGILLVCLNEFIVSCIELCTADRKAR